MWTGWYWIGYIILSYVAGYFVVRWIDDEDPVCSCMLWFVSPVLIPFVLCFSGFAWLSNKMFRKKDSSSTTEAPDTESRGPSTPASVHAPQVESYDVEGGAHVNEGGVEHLAQYMFDQLDRDSCTAVIRRLMIKLDITVIDLQRPALVEFEIVDREDRDDSG